MKTHGKTRLISETPRNSSWNIRRGPNSSKTPQSNQPTKPNHHAFQKPTVLPPLWRRSPTPCILWPTHRITNTIHSHCTRLPTSRSRGQKHPNLHRTHHRTKCLCTSNSQPTAHPPAKRTPRPPHPLTVKRSPKGSETLHPCNCPLWHPQPHPKPLQIISTNHKPRTLPKYRECKNPHTIWHHTCPLPTRHTPLPPSPQRSTNKTWQKKLLHPMLPSRTLPGRLPFLSMPLLPPHATQTRQKLMPRQP